MTAKPNKIRVLIAEDDASIRVIVNRALVEAGFEARATPSIDALEKWVNAGEGDVVVSDVYLGEESIFDRINALKLSRPELPFILMSGQNSILTAARAADHGAFDYLPKPFNIDALVQMVKRAAKIGGGTQSSRQRGAPRLVSAPDESFLGRSPAMQTVYRAITRVMNNDMPVFLNGETGSGRYLTAKSIHDLGNRNAGRFSTNLSDLDNVSTLYLPSVDLLSSADHLLIQDLLLQPDVIRVISATANGGRNLTEAGVPEGLSLRLQTLVIDLPPLRERRDDIADIAQASLERAVVKGLPRKILHPQALALLEKDDWPGNVHELESVIFRLCAFCIDTEITKDDVMAELVKRSVSASQMSSGDFESDISRIISRELWPKFLAYEDGAGSQIHKEAMDVIEGALLRLALEYTGQNKLKAAKLLGMNRNTLRARLEIIDNLDKV